MSLATGELEVSGAGPDAFVGPFVTGVPTWAPSNCACE